jgi:mannan endo-1,4-beta-mannosidase
MAANPNASESAQRVLAYLQEVSTSEQVLMGQHVAYRMDYMTSGFRNHVQPIFDQTGRWPSLIGADYGYGASATDLTNGNRILIDYWNCGGLITISRTLNNPWTGGDGHNLTDRNHTELITPGTAVYDAWMADLDHAADGLSELQDAGVVVLWRPLHEMTMPNTWWWGWDPDWGDAGPFRDVWTHMFDYFTNARGLNNLLWVYSAGNTDTYNPVDMCYPGDAYVDLVGIDVYSDTLEIRGDGYNRLLALGKPFALTEFGPQARDGTYDNMTTINRIRESFPAIVYVLQWHSWANNQVAITDNRNAARLMADPWVVDRDELDGQPVAPMPEDLTLVLAEMQTVAADLRGAADRLEAQVSAIQSDLTRIQRLDLAFDGLAAWARDLTDDV